MESDRRNPEPLFEDDNSSTKADEGKTNNFWLRKASDAYRVSTDYCKTNIWRQWRKNLCHFRNQHDLATKYANKSYAGRSKVFRPKTRSSLRAAEAALARALFSNSDLVNVSAGDSGSPEQRASAEVVKEILNYRLTKKLYWFLTAMGAYQNTHNYGICISKQSWIYESHTETVPIMAFSADQSVNGSSYMQNSDFLKEKEIVDKDDLSLDLIPPENFRFSPMADWRDPISTSPYIIELIPMYAGEVMEKMLVVDNKTGYPAWKQYSLDEILSSSEDEFNEVRRAREGDNRTDPADEFSGNEFSTVWVHQNIIREGGEDWIYFTLGTKLLLTDPKPLKEIYAQGRPYVVGISVIEAHKNYPSGGTELGVPLQQEINEIANQRLDNVRLVLNKRYYIKRSGNVDLEALKRNIPGSGVLMNDVDAVRTVDTNDVTSSSYAEQDRLSVEMDELLGNFSQSSIQSNRSLNETVGGMNLMGDSANSIQEYTIRTFIESWVEPVLRQCIKLIQMYETDTTIVSLCAKKANIYQKYKVEQITDEMLARDLTTTVNVGMGNTDPSKRVNKLMLGINTALGLPGAADRLVSDEVINELFANLGFKDGERFFSSSDENEAVEPPIDPKIMEIQARMQIAQQESELRQQQIQTDMQIATARLHNDREIAMMKIALDKDIKLSELKTRLGIHQKQIEQRDKEIQTSRDIAALREKNKLIDTDWKNRFAELKYSGNNA